MVFCTQKDIYCFPNVLSGYKLNNDTWEEIEVVTDEEVEELFFDLFISFDMASYYIWSDGINIYFSFYDHFVLHGDKWEVKTWNGSSDWTGNQTWTDGTNMYFSYYGYENESYVFS